MWPFKKRSIKNRETPTGTVTDKVAGKIAGYCQKLQNMFANKMNKMIGSMNTKRLKVTLVVFCICCGGYSIYLITNAITSSSEKQSKFKVEQMDVPQHFDKTGDEIISSENYVEEETFQKIQQFKNYMDSLKRKNSYQYDSIMNARPLLMDSVLLLEQIYHSQKQK